MTEQPEFFESPVMPDDPQFVVVDTETTGLDLDTAEVVELAAVDPLRPERRYVEQYGTSRPIPAEASAVHHLTDEDVTGFPLYDHEEWLQGEDRPVFIDAGTVLVAHNAAYDQPLVDPDHTFPWLCTRRIAQHLWPAAPRHSNQVLRYWLGLKPDLPPDLYPHRALYDALVTAELFKVELEKVDGDAAELLRLTHAPVELLTCRFGKHRGVPYDDVPTDYLRWILRQDFDTDVAHTARTQLQKRGVL